MKEVIHQWKDDREISAAGIILTAPTNPEHSLGTVHRLAQDWQAAQKPLYLIVDKPILWVLELNRMAEGFALLQMEGPREIISMPAHEPPIVTVPATLPDETTIQPETVEQRARTEATERGDQTHVVRAITTGTRGPMVVASTTRPASATPGGERSHNQSPKPTMTDVEFNQFVQQAFADYRPPLWDQLDPLWDEILPHMSERQIKSFLLTFATFQRSFLEMTSKLKAEEASICLRAAATFPNPSLVQVI
ncbi:MAG: hypothetical protein K1X70_10725 [Leptospirales bacterium]|nr:hypothetical protein [Leptospirales bacterium]HMW60046.1 hypothetical protein [Leptospiraceae bacterium]HNJ03150.1 hypothetical protein [Leptospiraceae bacterium]HNN58636.1 hypothetical protein [Leptospiraceae bacterium]HNN76032.1 hypothetical protein [Leptospiraceae bacterium]